MWKFSIKDRSSSMSERKGEEGNFGTCSTNRRGLLLDLGSSHSPSYSHSPTHSPCLWLEEEVTFK